MNHHNHVTNHMKILVRSKKQSCISSIIIIRLRDFN